jgi:hypothetical protein
MCGWLSLTIFVATGSALLQDGSGHLPSTSPERARVHVTTDLEDSIAVVVIQGRSRANLEDPSRMQQRCGVRRRCLLRQEALQAQ